MRSGANEIRAVWHRGERAAWCPAVARFARFRVAAEICAELIRQCKKNKKKYFSGLRHRRGGKRETSRCDETLFSAAVAAGKTKDLICDAVAQEQRVRGIWKGGFSLPIRAGRLRWSRKREMEVNAMCGRGAMTRRNRDCRRRQTTAEKGRGVGPGKHPPETEGVDGWREDFCASSRRQLESAAGPAARVTMPHDAPCTMHHARCSG
jgi:hypothetical protein